MLLSVNAFEKKTSISFQPCASAVYNFTVDHMIIIGGIGIAVGLAEVSFEDNINFKIYFLYRFFIGTNSGFSLPCLASIKLF